MVIKRITSNLRPTSFRHEVPRIFYEAHIETGFRQPHHPWRYYFCSIFQKNNECMNVWTHLLGFILILNRTMHLSSEFSLVGDRNMWPLTAGLFTMAAMYLCSAFVHCIQSKSERIHCMGFLVDYAGIALYGFGTVLLHHTYCTDETLLNSWMRRYSIPVGVLLSLVICVCCSISKVMYTKPYPAHRKLWQIVPIGIEYIWESIPLFHRFMMSFEKWELDESLRLHLLHMVWFVVAGFFYGSEMPQRIFPGRFDFLGHSHQIFHICVVIASLKQLNALYLDIKRMQPHFDAIEMPTFLESFGSVVLLILGSAANVLIFLMIVKGKLRQEGKLSQESKVKFE